MGEGVFDKCWESITSYRSDPCEDSPPARLWLVHSHSPIVADRSGTAVHLMGAAEHKEETRAICWQRFGNLFIFLFFLFFCVWLCFLICRFCARGTDMYIQCRKNKSTGTSCKINKWIDKWGKKKRGQKGRSDLKKHANWQGYCSDNSWEVYSVHNSWGESIPEEKLALFSFTVVFANMNVHQCVSISEWVSVRDNNVVKHICL